jgi:hypothetical protein
MKQTTYKEEIEYLYKVLSVDNPYVKIPECRRMLEELYKFVSSLTPEEAKEIADKVAML